MILHLHCPRVHIAALALPANLAGRSHCTISGRRKLPWRYRWPAAVRDDVLARLLALNAERSAEEVTLGLHSKGAKQASRVAKAGSTAGGKRRGRPPKTPPPDSGQTVQIGLVL
jgi:hypothetical protein